MIFLRAERLKDVLISVVRSNETLRAQKNKLNCRLQSSCGDQQTHARLQTRAIEGVQQLEQAYQSGSQHAARRVDLTMQVVRVLGSGPINRPQRHWQLRPRADTGEKCGNDRLKPQDNPDFCWRSFR